MLDMGGGTICYNGRKNLYVYDAFKNLRSDN